MDEKAYQESPYPGAGIESMELLQKEATHRQRLLAKQQRLKAELSRVEAALAALDSHPELENFITTLARAGI